MLPAIRRQHLHLINQAELAILLPRLQSSGGIHAALLLPCPDSPSQTLSAAVFEIHAEFGGERWWFRQFLVVQNNI